MEECFDIAIIAFFTVVRLLINDFFGIAILSSEQRFLLRPLSPPHSNPLSE